MSSISTMVKKQKKQKYKLNKSRVLHSDIRLSVQSFISAKKSCRHTFKITLAFYFGLVENLNPFLKKKSLVLNRVLTTDLLKGLRMWRKQLWKPRERMRVCSTDTLGGFGRWSHSLYFTNLYSLCDLCGWTPSFVQITGKYVKCH